MARGRLSERSGIRQAIAGAQTRSERVRARRHDHQNRDTELGDSLRRTACPGSRLGRPGRPDPRRIESAHPLRCGRSGFRLASGRPSRAGGGGRARNLAGGGGIRGRTPVQPDLAGSDSGTGSFRGRAIFRSDCPCRRPSRERRPRRTRHWRYGRHRSARAGRRRWGETAVEPRREKRIDEFRDRGRKRTRPADRTGTGKFRDNCIRLPGRRQAGEERFGQSGSTPPTGYARTRCKAVGTEARRRDGPCAKRRRAEDGRSFADNGAGIRPGISSSGIRESRSRHEIRTVAAGRGERRDRSRNVWPDFGKPQG